MPTGIGLRANFDMKTEQMTTEHMNECMEHVQRVVGRRCNINTKKHPLTYETNLRELLEGNIFLMGHIVLDLFEILDLPILHIPGTEYQTIETVEDLVCFCV